jgi:hypothetical protein
MPVTYRINKDIVEMSLDGECPPDEVIQTFHEAMDDPAAPPQFGLFLDVRNSTSLAKRSTQEIIRVAEHLGPHKDRVRRCAVLATEQVHFGLSRLGAVYSETAGVMTSVFRDRDEALKWLRGEINHF